jgi:hypothetical protein
MSTEKVPEDGVPVPLPRTDVMVGVLMPEGGPAAGSSLIRIEERTEWARNGLGGGKGLGKRIVPGEDCGICAGETCGSGAEIGLGNLTDCSMMEGAGGKTGG